MNTDQPTSGCRVIVITSARPASTTQLPSPLSLLPGQRPVNLATLAEAIRADRSLCYFVTEAACAEFGYPWLSVEDAIVLLGVSRLRALLASPVRRGRSAAQLRRVLHRNSITPPADLRSRENFQGEPK
jgi:hypothetical protein